MERRSRELCGSEESGDFLDGRPIINARCEPMPYNTICERCSTSAGVAAAPRHPPRTQLRDGVEGYLLPSMRLRSAYESEQSTAGASAKPMGVAT